MMRKDLLILCLVFLVLKSSIIFAPIHWDAASYVVPSGVWYRDNSLFTVAQPDYGHPPLLFWLLGIAYRIFGTSVLVPHLINMVFGLLALIFTYECTQMLYNRKAAIISAILLMLSPLFFAQSGTLNTDITATGLAVMSFYFFLNNRWRAYTICASLLVLAKETGILLIISISAYSFIKKKRPLLAASPVIVLGLWLAYYYLMTGSIFYSQHSDWLFSWLTDFGQVFEKLRQFMAIVFIDNGMFAPAILALINYKKAHFRQKNLVILLLFMLVMLFYALYDQSLPRHIMLVMPFIMISYSGVIYRMRFAYVFTAIAGAIMIFNFVGASSSACGCELEMNMEYMDMVNVHQDAVQFLEKSYPNAVILTTWPMVAELTEPSLGYVKEPLEAYSPYNHHIKGYDVHDPSLDYDVIVYAEQSNVYQLNVLIEIMRNHSVNEIKKFERNGKKVTVYEVWQ